MARLFFITAPPTHGNTTNFANNTTENANHHPQPTSRAPVCVGLPQLNLDWHAGEKWASVRPRALQMKELKRYGRLYRQLEEMLAPWGWRSAVEGLHGRGCGCAVHKAKPGLWKRFLRADEDSGKPWRWGRTASRTWTRTWLRTRLRPSRVGSGASSRRWLCTRRWIMGGGWTCWARLAYVSVGWLTRGHARSRMRGRETLEAVGVRSRF
ncbi:hypothetical protein GE09DRAFT_334405 [Coniochaeta sp. 2T2.1]|nr:hypothetical protein GE09DRAFT_334405 [Coniochaeta sp. 2T2.1]